MDSFQPSGISLAQGMSSVKQDNLNYDRKDRGLALEVQIE